jgi:hypothetical protein
VVEAARTPQPGELIAGKYAIEGQLGRGGMGTVYAARHVSTGRRFAIKLLKPQLAGDAEAEARFTREATLASAINHPAIVEVYDVGRHGDAPYMVMKLLHGESLGQRLQRGAMGPDEAIAVMLPVLDGIAAAHDRGIIHRDLKPDNILLQREGTLVQPKVLDFGISKLLGPDARTRLTQSGVSLGTPLYMSPEQVRGDDDVDHRADVYALGVILYEMLTGALPYEGNNYPSLVLQIVQGGAPRVRERNPNVSSALDATVMRAFAVSRDERHANARQLARELQGLTGAAPARIDARISRAPATPAATPFTASGARSAPPAPYARSAARYVALSLAAVAAVLLLLWLTRGGKEVRAGSATRHTETRAATSAAPALPEPVRPTAAASATAPATPAATAPGVAAPPRAPSTPAKVAAAPATTPRAATKIAGPRQAAQVAEPQPASRAQLRPATQQTEPAPAATKAVLEIRPAPEPHHRTHMPSEIIDPFEK